MSNLKHYNKSMIFNFQESPRFNYDTIKSIKSSEHNSNRIDEENRINTFKNKLKQINKDKFYREDKNDALIGRPNIQHKNTIHPNRNKNYYMKLLDSIYQNESHLDRTNVKLKYNQNNTKNSSLIPFPKKISKDKLVKEEDIIKEDVKKRKSHSKKKEIDNDGNQIDGTGIKKKTKKYNSSHLILKLKKKSSNSLRKYSEIDRLRDILQDEKNKKSTKNVNGNEVKSKDDNKKVIEENKSENKSEKMVEGKNIDQLNINEKENKMNDNISYDNKEIQVKKKNYNNEHNKSKVIVDINHVETKSKNEIVKYTNKEKEKGEKRRKGFPLCCFIIKDDSSDNE
jgi:hypothetical protein